MALAETRQVVERYLLAAMDLIREKATTTGVRRIESRVVTFPKAQYANRAVSYQVGSTRDLGMFVLGHAKSLAALSEASELLDVLSVRPLAAGMGVEHANLVAPAQELLRRHNRLPVPARVISELAHEIALLVSSDRLEYRGRFVLTDFTASGRSLKLDGSNVLRRLRLGEARVLEQRALGGFQASDHFHPTDWIVETRFKAAWDGWRQDLRSLAEPSARRVVTALRLVKEGSVGYREIAAESIIWTPLKHTFGSTYSVRPYLRNDEYQIRSQERRQVVRMWLLLERPFPEYLRVAIDRFNQSYMERQWVDAIVELAIAIEALFVRQQQELSLRFRTFPALFLARSADRRLRISAFLGAAYSVRSRTVHGGSPPQSIPVDGKSYRTDELARILRRIVAACIVAALAWNTRDIAEPRGSLSDLCEQLLMGGKAAGLKRIRRMVRLPAEIGG